MDTRETGRLLQRGEKYLLFVRPAARDAEYVLTGTVTSYRWSGAAYQRVDDIRAGSPRLPAVVTWRICSRSPIRWDSYSSSAWLGDREVQHRVFLQSAVCLGPSCRSAG